MNIFRRCVKYASRLPRKPVFWLCIVVLYGALHVLGSYYYYYYALPEPMEESSLEVKFSRPRKSSIIGMHHKIIETNNSSNYNTTTSVLGELPPLAAITTILPSSSSSPLLTLIPGPIFFNIFVSANISNIRRILTEQFLQRNQTSPNATIEYTLIGGGDGDAMNEEIQQLCQPHCRQRKHMKSGNEVETLQALWEYCKSSSSSSRGQQQQQQLTTTTSHSSSPSQQEDVLVTYLHNKGSFHATESNEKSRRMGTKSALDCRHLMESNPKQCTICTSAFHVLPQYLGSSNMWTARCSYIRKLHPPNNYSNMMEFMYQTTLNHSELSNSKYACLKPRDQSPNHLGLGRFAFERWSFSHPDVRPCDVVPHEGEISPDFPQTWDPNLRRAPHEKPKQIGIQFGPYKASFARLAGRLHEWSFVYGKIPSNHSWVWKWYRGYEVGTPKLMQECREKENAVAS